MDPSAPLRVAVLSGGRSGEREISLSSGRGVLEALSVPDPVRPTHGLDVRLEVDGSWSVAGERGPPAAALARLATQDVVFLALHGGAGEDGSVQGLLEGFGLRYTGSGVRASALCMDKHALRLLAAEAGLVVPPGFCVSLRDWKRAAPAVLDRAAGLGEHGWFVKPRCGGSSVSTASVRELRHLTAAVEAALDTGDDALLESRVVGVEVSCAVLGDHDGELRSFTPIEIRPADGSFFDYQQKYDAEHGAQELCPPESLDALACDHVRELAERAHRIAGCHGYSRVDFICPPAGAPVLLEVNTLPGLTPRSLLPQEAAHDGMAYRDLILAILDQALARPERA